MMPLRRPIIAATLLCTVVVASAGVWYFRPAPRVRAARLLAEARSLYSRGHDADAEQRAQAALQLDPTLLEAALLAADLNHHQLDRLKTARQAYLSALKTDPDCLEANEGLARLLALCAQSREAVPNILRIIRQEAQTDLLVLLARRDGVLNEAGELAAASDADPSDANPLVGRAWHAATVDRHDEAIALLREALKRSPDHMAARLALGQELLATRQFDELVGWTAELTPAADDYSQAWLVRARFAENDGQPQAAIRCYWECLRREPESKSANARLAQLLAEIGRAEDASRFAAQVQRAQSLEAVQNHVLFSNAEAADLLQLARSYTEVGRYWEAFGWCQAAVRLKPGDQSAQQALVELRQKCADLPLKLTADVANPALQIDLSSFPLPQYRAPAAGASVTADTTGPAISFRNDADAAGLRFRYHNGPDDGLSHRMFEFTGGGIAVLDFDVDGYADVFFTQGGAWPVQTGTGTTGDQLFRNRGAIQFEAVTDQAGFQPAGFGQGATVGDVNQDGFPDLYAAHIGANQLWVNNGDGTFSDVTVAAGVEGSATDWTTSCLMADLNHDQWPDIYVANYVWSEDVFDRICRHSDGAPKICMPFDFEAQPDRLWLNDGAGGFVEASSQVLSFANTGKGLGLAAWDPFHNGQLCLLVSNDTTPNSFLVPESAANGEWRLSDRGFEYGLATDGEGKAKGCMGVALGDLNADGFLDICITNFLSESSTLYLSRPDGGLDDRTRETGLLQLTAPLLGFGTQFLDVDLDGRLELFQTSGHIDDFRKYGKPYKMPPKLFRWNSQRLVDVPASELGAYFQDQWLGRSVVRLDWNRDGREDLIVGHLYDDYALLTNTTAAGNSLSLRLIGVESNRDAIGARVEVRVQGKSLVRQLTAGDGYQASNERLLIVGLGAATQADEIIIHWPSGTVQHLTKIPTPREIIVIEGRKAVLAQPDLHSSQPLPSPPEGEGSGVSGTNGN
jgi:tetratricopeptide (TPR) repeat protein